MGKVIPTIVLLMGMGAAFYLLYIHGCLATNAKRAVRYIASMGGRKASFTSCTGYTKRVVRFKESGTVRFNLALELSEGSVTAELLDRTKQRVLGLNSDNPSGSIQVEGKQRYDLVFRFQSATGSCLLSWE